MFLCFRNFLKMLLCFLMSCFCCCYNINVQIDAFLVGKLLLAFISWIERMFCKSIIDFLLELSKR